MFETEIKMCLRRRWNSSKNRMGGLEGRRRERGRERGRWWLQNHLKREQRRQKLKQRKHLIRETVWRRGIEKRQEENILKEDEGRWFQKKKKRKERGKILGRQKVKQCSSSATLGCEHRPCLILQLCVVIKWEGASEASIPSRRSHCRSARIRG